MTPSRFAATAVLTAGLFVAAGCGTRTGQTLVEYKPAQPAPATAQVDQEGQYELVNRSTGQVIRKARLAKGSNFGFRDRGGRSYAFAQVVSDKGGRMVMQDYEQQLDDPARGNYAWRYAGR